MSESNTEIPKEFIGKTFSELHTYFFNTYGSICLGLFNNEKNKSPIWQLIEIIHPIIRNQINQFVNTKSLFKEGIKFVILDEIDYMTKNAQQALKYLIQQYSENVRFCLICNYISRIDLSLQNEFIKLKFCQLPKQDINRFLNNIIKKEKIKITEMQTRAIQIMFGSDIRSMINYLQSNQHVCFKKNKIITNAFWQQFIIFLKDNKSNKCWK